MKRLFAAVFALAALLLFAAPSSVEPIFARGETLDYDLTWLSMTGGRARMTIAPQTGDPVNNYLITSVAQTSSGFSRIYKVKDQIESVVSRATFTTIRYHKDLREGSSHKNDTTTYANGVATRKAVSYTHLTLPTICSV